MVRVSVIVPAYNAMDYLPETISTVLAQTYDDFEVIVVNDGSSDETEQWVSQIKNPRIKLVSQENQGLAGARNTGIFHARGEYIAFLDADDLWEPSKLEKQVRVLENHPEVGLVYTWVAYIDEKGESTGRVFKHEIEGEVWQQLTEHNIVESGSVAMVRRSCLENVGLFDQNLGSYVEDWDMWMRIATCYPFKVVKEPLVYYRQISNSASRNWEAMARSFGLVIEKAFTTAPLESQYLKKRSYSSANLCLAWKALQSCSKDWKVAVSFRSQALAYYPGAFFSREFMRLSFAIFLMRWFGAGGYEKFLGTFHVVRRHISNIASNS